MPTRKEISKLYQSNSPSKLDLSYLTPVCAWFLWSTIPADFITRSYIFIKYLDCENCQYINATNVSMVGTGVAVIRHESMVLVSLIECQDLKDLWKMDKSRTHVVASISNGYIHKYLIRETLFSS